MPNLRDVTDLIPARAIQSAGPFIVQLGNDLSRCSSRYSEIFLSPAHQSFSISPAAAFLIDRHQFDLSLIVLYRSAKYCVPSFFSGDDPNSASGGVKAVLQPAFIQCGLKWPKMLIPLKSGMPATVNSQLHTPEIFGKNFHDFHRAADRNSSRQQL